MPQLWYFNVHATTCFSFASYRPGPVKFCNRKGWQTDKQWMLRLAAILFFFCEQLYF